MKKNNANFFMINPITVAIVQSVLYMIFYLLGMSLPSILSILSCFIGGWVGGEIFSRIVLLLISNKKDTK